jgi:hypothetical protein
MIRKSAQIILLILAASALGCTFHIQPVVSEKVFANPPERIAANVLLKVPDDFWEFEYVASYEGREIRYFLGRSAWENIPALFRAMFSSASMADDVGENPKYDWIATLRWGQQNSYVRPFVFGIETNLQVDFVSYDSKKSFSTSAKGKGEAHAYTQSSLQSAGDDGMRELMINLQERILSKEQLFVLEK